MSAEKRTIEIVASRKFGVPVEIEKCYEGTDSSGEKSGVLIEGYASTSALDRVRDIVHPSAFKGAVNDFMANPVLTYAHDLNSPIGKVIQCRITTTGFWVKAFVSEGAGRILRLIRDGVLKGFSIGYKIVTEERRGDVNHILALKLHEIAVVSIPCNPETLFSLAKAFHEGATVEQIKALHLEITRTEESKLIEIVPANHESKLIEIVSRGTV